MTPSKTLLYLCISFIIGIALQSIIKIPQAFVWGFLMCGVLVIVISFLRGKHIFVVLGFCVLLFVLGIARLQISEFSISADTLGALRDNPAKITLEGNVISEPDVGASTQKIKVKIEKAESIVLVTTVRYPEFHYLDTVQITGKLKTPPMIEDFNYKNYLQKDGIYSVMDFPVVEVIPQEYSHGAGTFLFSKLLQFKGKLRDSINQNFPPPHSALLEGILLGNTSGMDKETKSKMGAVGLTHLTAISGSNVVILVNILMVFLLFLGLWRGQAFYVSAVFIWLYVAIAAFPASGIRAAVMASVFLLAQKLGRQNTTSRVIILAGALMLLQNPMLLIHDVGFQLSFLASMGIIHGKPIIDYFFRFIENKNARFFVDIFSITMAAQVFTFPIVLEASCCICVALPCISEKCPDPGDEIKLSVIFSTLS